MMVSRERACGRVRGWIDEGRFGPGGSQDLRGGRPREVFTGGPPLAGAYHIDGNACHGAAVPHQTLVEMEEEEDCVSPRGRSIHRGETRDEIFAAPPPPAPLPEPPEPTTLLTMDWRRPLR